MARPKPTKKGPRSPRSDPQNTLVDLDETALCETWHLTENAKSAKAHKLPALHSTIRLGGLHCQNIGGNTASRFQSCKDSLNLTAGLGL